MEEVSDFCCEYMDHTTKLCVAIPEGHIYAMVSTGGHAVRWSFGCLDDIETDRTKACLRFLFESYPTVDTGDYHAFGDWMAQVCYNVE